MEKITFYQSVILNRQFEESRIFACDEFQINEVKMMPLNQDIPVRPDDVTATSL